MSWKALMLRNERLGNGWTLVKNVIRFFLVRVREGCSRGRTKREQEKKRKEKDKNMEEGGKRKEEKGRRKQRKNEEKEDLHFETYPKDGSQMPSLSAARTCRRTSKQRRNPVNSKTRVQPTKKPQWRNIVAAPGPNSCWTFRSCHIVSGVPIK